MGIIILSPILLDTAAETGEELFFGPVEADKTHIGGKRKNMSNAKRKEMEDAGRGPVGKEAAVGVKDRATNKVRAKVVPVTDTANAADEWIHGGGKHVLKSGGVDAATIYVKSVEVSWFEDRQ